jgi:hypothetical protein
MCRQKRARFSGKSITSIEEYYVVSIDLYCEKIIMHQDWLSPNSNSLTFVNLSKPKIHKHFWLNLCVMHFQNICVIRFARFTFQQLTTYSCYTTDSFFCTAIITFSLFILTIHARSSRF